MTGREARTRRRLEERKQAKIASKAAKSASGESAANASIEAAVPVARFNPDIEDEFPRELQIEANLVRDRIHRNASLKPDGFVSQSAPEPAKRAETNRLNSQKSTGPTSPQGKLASSRNSLKHGLTSGTIMIPGEDPAAFEALQMALLEEHQPANITEELLVNEMAQSYWLTQRAIRFQNECFTENGLDEKRLALFLRYQTTHGRAFHKALNTLLRLQECRGEACLAGFVSQSRSPSQTQSGFVPQNQQESSATPATDQEFVWKKDHDMTAEAA